MTQPDKFPDGVTAEDVRVFKRLVARCWIVAGLLIELPLESLDRYVANAETVGPALYPDIWRANAQNIMEDREMIRALLAAQRDVMITSPALVELAPFISEQADASRASLGAAFRELFSQPRFGPIPPAVILTALVRFIADHVPTVNP